MVDDGISLSEERQLIIAFALWSIASIYFCLDAGYSIHWIVIGGGVVGGVLLSQWIDITKGRQHAGGISAVILSMVLVAIFSQKSLRPGAFVLSATVLTLRLYKEYR